MDKEHEIKRLYKHLECLVNCCNTNLAFDDSDIVTDSMRLAYQHVLVYMKSHDLI